MNGKVGQNCTVTCQEIVPPFCGNGNLDAGEECDDGNVINDDGCNIQCRIEYGNCGDGIKNAALGEECDLGSGNGQPETDCDDLCKWLRLPQCGDGVLDPSSEQCDNGDSNGNYRTTKCLDNCVLPYCGDGVIEINEQCDDGNTLDGDGCDHTCRDEIESVPSPPIAGELIPRSGTPPVVLPPVSGTDEKLPDNIPTPAKSEQGPGLAIFLASGIAAAYGLARRRMLKR